MKNIIKSVFLLITTLCSTVIINAMDINQQIYLQFSDGIQSTYNKNDIKGIGLIEKKIKEKKGFSQNDPINIPSTATEFEQLLSYANMPQNYLVSTTRFYILQDLLKLATRLQYYDFIHKLNQALPPQFQNN